MDKFEIELQKCAEDGKSVFRMIIDDYPESKVVKRKLKDMGMIDVHATHHPTFVGVSNERRQYHLIIARSQILKI